MVYSASSHGNYVTSYVTDEVNQTLVRHADWENGQTGFFSLGRRATSAFDHSSSNVAAVRFYQQMEASDFIGFRSTTGRSFASRREFKKKNKKKQAHDVHTHFTPSVKNTSHPPSAWREALFCFVWRCSSMVSSDKTLVAHTPMLQHGDWYKMEFYGALLWNVAGALSRQGFCQNRSVLSWDRIRSVLTHCCTFPPSRALSPKASFFSLPRFKQTECTLFSVALFCCDLMKRDLGLNLNCWNREREDVRSVGLPSCMTW